MGFFSERRLLAYKHTRTHLLLMTFFKCYWIVFLWELSTPPHTHTQQYLPRLPSQLFAGNTHPFSGDVARGSSCTHKSRAPFWEMKGSKDTYIHLHTNWESKNRGRGAEHRSPSISASPFWQWRGWIDCLPSAGSKWEAYSVLPPVTMWQSELLRYLGRPQRSPKHHRNENCFWQRRMEGSNQRGEGKNRCI